MSVSERYKERSSKVCSAYIVAKEVGMNQCRVVIFMLTSIFNGGLMAIHDRVYLSSHSDERPDRAVENRALVTSNPEGKATKGVFPFPQESQDSHREKA